MSDVVIVGLVSSYLEGRLVKGAIESLLEVDLDALYVFEGAAGDAVDADVPESELVQWEGRNRFSDLRQHRFVVERGTWRTDARKRTAMLQRAQQDFPGVPLWGVVLDGDEILHNGRFLRDLLQKVAWDDDARDADQNDEENAPTAHWPIRLVEVDGGITTMQARLIRLDLLREYTVSSSLLTNIHGIKVGWGNVEDGRVWIELWMEACERNRLVAWPPGPCEPAIVHRSHLRHPARRGVRMSEQETRELARAKREAALELSEGVRVVDHELGEGVLDQ